ncbi:flotillin family protein [Homoserinibacter sp. YIM 151385]|uniref:flotillin family protein n=1 Tax=Homoserinibacter sp. YIM 151385 TaxID=2985506 RepID=UPI0022F01F14|nr:flotillin family protein [Homoserinibacter sp. YIM 151385]WBU39056.1 SPFH domain-containing protein [Homoserinibacter sp. YIM 151385]
MDFLSTNITVIAVIALIIVALAIVGFVAGRIKRVPPNQALVIVGRGAGGKVAEADTGQRVVIGGRVFIWPILQQGFPVSLEQRQIGIVVEGVDQNFIKLAIQASVNFKVSGTAEGVRRAAQRFLSQQNSLTQIIQQSLEGSLRSIIGNMPIKEIISNRNALSEAVVEATKVDLAEQGLQVDLLNISDISTPGTSYLADLGRAEAAIAKQNAEVKEAESARASEFARIEAAEQIAERQKALSLKQAGIKAETDRANAEAEAAGQLAKAGQDRLVATQEREAVAEQAKVEQERLDIEVRKPAEASAYATVQKANAERDAANAATEADAFKRKTIAEANKVAAVQDAQAAAEAVRLAGVAERDKQVALAEGIRAEGEARAAATAAEGLAEAQATDAKAEALKKYGDAALASEIIGRLPDITRAVAEPLSNIGNLTVVSTDGASAVTKTVGQVASEVPQVVKSLTGLDLSALLGAAAGTALGGGSASADGGSGRKSRTSVAERLDPGAE